MNKKPAPPRPDWLRYVADNAMLNVKDTAALLGISQAGLRLRVSKGTFPAPEWRQRGFGPISKPRAFWRASTVRTYLAEQDRRLA